VGQEIEALRGLQWFFGATTVSAPREFDVWGTVVPNLITDEDEWFAWELTYGAATIYGKAPHRFALRGVGIRDPQTGLILHLDTYCHIESVKAAQQFIKDYLPGLAKSTSYTGGEFPLHAMLVNDERRKGLVFCNESEYFSRLNYNQMDVSPPPKAR
jgi:hypothetical protein